MEIPNDPFINVQGIFNFRDIGGLAIHREPQYSVRRHSIFRCANPGRATADGMQQIRDLGITTIFDLRSPTEIERTKDFAPTADIPGVKRQHVPVYVHDEYPAHQSVENLRNYISANRHDSKGAYVDLLDNGEDAFRAIFAHLRDKPYEGCLIHCSAGKDRTGVAVALILAVAGVDYSTIEREYMLTEEGLKPMKKSVIRYLSEKSGSEWTDERVSSLLGLRSVKTTSMPARMKSIAYKKIRLDALREMLDTLRDTYNNAEEYLRTRCGFSDQDVALIKKKLRVKAA